MMLQQAIESNARIRRTTTETGVALARRLTIVESSARPWDAPTEPCPCSSRARYELPSVRNLRPSATPNGAAGTARRGESPRCQEVDRTLAWGENAVKPM